MKNFSEFPTSSRRLYFYVNRITTDVYAFCNSRPNQPWEMPQVLVENDPCKSVAVIASSESTIAFHKSTRTIKVNSLYGICSYVSC